MEVDQPPQPESADNGQDHDCDPIPEDESLEHQPIRGAKCDTASDSPAASVGAAAAAAEPLAVAGCSARGGPHDSRRPNANKKRSQPFRTPKTKNNIFPSA